MNRSQLAQLCRQVGAKMRIIGDSSGGIRASGNFPVYRIDGTLTKTRGKTFRWDVFGRNNPGPTGWLLSASTDFTNPFNREAKCTISGENNAVDDDFYVGYPLNKYALGGAAPESGPHQAFSIDFTVAAHATVHLDLWNGGPPNVPNDIYAISITIKFE